MRIIIFLTFIISVLTADDNLIANINNTLQKVINENKKIIDDVKISYDPFNIKKPEHVEKKVDKDTSSNNKEIKTTPNKPILSMIFNKKAFINGSWYKVDDKFADYRIVKINQDIVVLRKKNKYTTLKLPTSDNILITKEEIW